MSTFKNSRSPRESEGYGRDGKRAKLADGGSIEMADGNSPAGRQRYDEIEITVTLRSASKAVRNDPNLNFSPAPWVNGPPCITYRVLRSDETPAIAGAPSPSLNKRPDAGGLLPPPYGNYGHNRPITPADAMGDSDVDLKDGGLSSSDDHPFLDDDYDEESDFSDSSSLQEGAEYQWLEQIDGVGRVNGVKIASCDAKLIRRHQIKSSFWKEMEAPTEETSCLAFGLFDRYGRLSREFCEHEIRKGTGVWGEELDMGDILLFESITVQSPWRGHHIASKMVGATLNKARAKSTHFFALVRPGVLSRELRVHKEENRLEIEKDVELVAINFWRSLGFRQVGTSGWFAFTDDANHPSRQLQAADDQDEPTRPKNHGPITKEQAHIMEGFVNPATSGAECVQRIRDAFPDVETARFWLSETDYEGDTMLHAAALEEKAEAVTYILSICPHLSSVRNEMGYTALEAFQAHQEERRTREGDVLTYTLVKSDEFTGFRQGVVATLGALTGTETFDLTKLSNGEIASVWVPGDLTNSVPEADTIRASLRMRYGCTCGHCTGGFLSPRMRCALHCVASLKYDQLRDDQLRDDLGNGFWEILLYGELYSLPRALRMNLAADDGAAEGFINTFAHVAHCLREGWLPTEENVLHLYRRRESEEPPVTSKFLQSGGSVGVVATMIFEEAMKRDKWAGYGDFDDCFGSQIDELPSCRNDHEYGFVSGLYGYKRVASGRHVG